MKILIFGDSITQGYYDDALGGWVQRLRLYLRKKEEASKDPNEWYNVFNLGVSGDDTKRVLNRLADEAKHRIFKWDSKKETVIMISVGAGDTEINYKSSVARVSPTESIKNVKNIIKTAKRYAARAVYIGLTPIDESKTTPIPWHPKYSYIEKRFKEYNEFLKKACSEEKIPFIDVYDKLEMSGYKKTLADGIHPNPKGHEMIFSIVKDFLLSERIIKP